MGKKNVIIMIIVAVVFAGGGFFGGYKYAQAKKPAASAASRGAGFRTGTFAGRGTGAAAGGFVTGQIIAQDSTSITVKSSDGSSKIIFLAGSTTIGKMTAGSVSDLTNGENVVVTGTANSDGSVTAQNIQIRPAGSPTGAPGTTSTSTSTSTSTTN
jgi:hypothetical protein